MITTAGTQVEQWPAGRLAVVYFFLDLEQMIVLLRPSFQGDHNERAHALALEVTQRLIDRGGSDPDEWVERGGFDPDEWVFGEFDGWRVYQCFVMDESTAR